MFLLGYDIGSSSVKVALVNAADGAVIGTTQYPEQEMPISSPYPDWAEQHPEDWWEATCAATRLLLAKTEVNAAKIASIGLAYQMHGLVCLDHAGKVLRSAIIWCDSRAVGIGDQAFTSIGEKFCLEHYLNSPGNFTASKLRWIRENEPDIFQRIDKIMLPGDYIAYRMTGEIQTTICGLSEGILWDFKSRALSRDLLEYYQIPEKMIPETVPVFSIQGKLNPEAANALGLSTGIPLGYRSGDQPNNALALNVLRAGEIAASGGTSGVVYALAEQPVFDPCQRVNSFTHVNYTPEKPLTGILLCINGAGSLYRWVRENMSYLRSAGRHMGYNEMEQLATNIPIGSEGLCILPFGNGAERLLGNKNPGAHITGLQFNRHTQRHFFRASLEGIAFAFVHGMQAMRDLKIPMHTLRAGNDNLFQSAIFSNTIASLMGIEIEVFNTTGASGAAKAAGVSVGIYASPETALAQHQPLIARYGPSQNNEAVYKASYALWKDQLSGVAG